MAQVRLFWLIKQMKTHQPIQASIKPLDTQTVISESSENHQHVHSEEWQ